MRTVLSCLESTSHFPTRQVVSRAAGRRDTPRQEARERSQPGNSEINVRRSCRPDAASIQRMTEPLIDPVAHNRLAWDRQVEKGNEWSRPVTPDVVAKARVGNWSVVLIGYNPVDRSWFPADVAGRDVLCLA